MGLELPGEEAEEHVKSGMDIRSNATNGLPCYSSEPFDGGVSSLRLEDGTGATMEVGWLRVILVHWP